MTRPPRSTPKRSRLVAVAPVRRWWRRILARIDAWAARPDEPRPSGSQIHRAAREVTGGIGLATTRAWDTMTESHERYLSSFDPRIPPSAFISAADVQRRGSVMPLAERCLEDIGPRRDGVEPADR